MSDPAQTTAVVDWEKRYKDEQAELTRLQQERAQWQKDAAEHATWKQRYEAGEIVDRTAYDKVWQDHVAAKARDNPEQFLAEVGLDGIARSAANFGSGDVVASQYPGYDSSVLQPNSEAQKRFAAEYGQRSLEKLYLAQQAPEIMRATGLDRTMEQYSTQLQEMRAELERTKEESARNRQYSEAAWATAQEVQDPLVRKIRDLQKPFREKPAEAWRQLAAMQDELDAFRKKASEPPAVHQPIPAETQAARIAGAATVPGAAGVPSGAPDSRPVDPLERAIQEALAESGAR